LPSFNNTGIKIKLLNALYNGRHCVVNPQMIEGVSLAEVCHVLDGAAAFSERISLLYHQAFTADEKEFRQKTLQKEFCNNENAKRIIRKIWNE